MNLRSLALRSIHPFPARMAPSIIHRRLKAKHPIRVVDPMAGSGTTIVAARLCGHHALGFDTDPLALTIAKAWSSDADASRLRAAASRTLDNARARHRFLTRGEAYPRSANEETRSFVRFWFDVANRRQLAALAESIADTQEARSRAILWCAFSRMIITKGAGVSLAIDVSHSRPHRAYKVAPFRPFDRFLPAMEQVLRGLYFPAKNELPAAKVRRGDARAIPLSDNSADMVITSPPYLNAIDYLRGHKLSLVWMGHQISDLRRLRSGNIGSERSDRRDTTASFREAARQLVRGFNKLPGRAQAMLAKYLDDMDKVLGEISRILIRDGDAVIVVANSTIRGVFVNNSRLLTHLARGKGLRLVSSHRRRLRENRRYLPPPRLASAGVTLRSRMNEEVILTFRKTFDLGHGGQS